MRRALSLVLLVCLTACGGGGNNLTGPSNSIPSVAGNYSGTVTITFPELNQSVNCAASTAITQSGATVNMAPLTLGAPCNITIPIGQDTIDTTGNLTSGGTTGTYTDPSCGTYKYVGSGGFFGNQLKLSILYTSATCINFSFSATLTRQ